MRTMSTVHIYQADPDVIVGHEFSGVTLDVLLHRMRDLKADAWSRIGRFKRDRWPRLRGGLNSHILNGRLILDLASDGSKVGMHPRVAQLCQSRADAWLCTYNRA